MGTTGAADSSKPHQYDVFINHRGKDVKNTFVAHLYDHLKRGGFRPFLDAIDIVRGGDLYNSIDEALKGARVHVAIFSKGYAESEYCLSELCDMLESGKEILPVFYHVKPEHLRRIEGGPFDEGFRKHSQRGKGEQIEKWKKALFKVSNRMGFILDEVNGNEVNLIRNIMDALRQSGHMMSSMASHSNGAVADQSVQNSMGSMQQQPVSYPEVQQIPVSRDLSIRDPTTISETQPNVSTTSLQRDVPPEQDGHPHGEGENTLGDVGSVEQPQTQAQETGDRRLNILVLGDPESVEAVISHVCGAGKPRTPVTDHQKLTETMNSRPPICLYGTTMEIYRNNFKVIKAFVKARNGNWDRTEVEALWAYEVDHNDPRKWTALSPELRLHAVWFVCKKTSDLPNRFKWSEITKLCDLPVQILVIHDSRTADFKTIFERGSALFPNAQKLEELILDVALNDKDLKEKLWRECWGAKTRAEIWNAAKIIREIRKQLGPEGKSSHVGVGGGVIKKEVSLRRSGEFVLNFLCTYWNVPQGSIRHVLTKSTTFKQPLAKKNSIKPYEFVKFCLTVAAIILYDAGEPKYVSNWDVTSESSFGQFLQTEPYFDSKRSLLYYDNMGFEVIREFLQSIFERKDSTSCVASVDKSNLSGHKSPNASRLNGWRPSCLNWCRTNQVIDSRPSLHH